MSAISRAAVEMETVVLEVRPVGPKAKVYMSLRYAVGDPFAVEVVFRSAVACGESVRWSFGRELLAAGLDRPAGLGDVRLWPWATPRGDFVAIALSSLEGRGLFEVPRAVLARFLRRSYVLVPAGSERERLDVDGVIGRLLAAT